MTDTGNPTEGRRYHHGDLKSALITVATDLLECDGAEGLSFRAVARDAGVSQTAPYKHFSGKAELLATVAEGGFRALEVSQLAAAKKARPGKARLVALGLDYIQYATARPQLYRLMFGVGVANWHDFPSVAKVKRASFEPVRAVLAEHLGSRTSAATLEAAAIAAWGLVHGLSMLKIDGSLIAGDAKDDLRRQRAALGFFAAGLGAAAVAKRQ